ncbi:hypothetical protein [Shewanella algae]|uniref:hypothetical protein n=1 Tax=Shewanella algae TaxID=38313 RepID=UPI003007916F
MKVRTGKRTEQITEFISILTYAADKSVTEEEVFRAISLYRALLKPAQSIHALNNLASIDGGLEVIKGRYISNSLNICGKKNLARHNNTTLDDEINWISNLIHILHEDVNIINSKSFRFEKEFLLGSVSESVKIISEIKNDFGTSIWLESAELCTTFFLGDHKKHSEINVKFEKVEDGLSKTSLTYACIKTNKSIPADRYLFSLGKMIEEVTLSGNDDLIEIINFKHNFDPAEKVKDHKNLIMNVSEQPIKDIYEAYIKLIQILHTNNYKFENSIKRITELREIIDDRRLKVLIDNITKNNDHEDQFDVQYKMATKLYVSEQYEKCIETCIKNLNIDPTLTVFYEIYIKSLIQLESQGLKIENKLSGVIGDIFEISKNIYTGSNLEKNIDNLKKVQIVLNHFNWSNQLLICIKKNSSSLSSEVYPYYRFIDSCCIRNNYFTFEKTGELIKNITEYKIPQWRISKSKAEHEFFNKRYSLAKTLYEKSLDTCPEFYKNELISKIIQCVFLGDSYKNTIKLLSSTIMSGVPGQLLPLQKIAQNISEQCTFKLNNTSLIEEALILTAYKNCYDSKYVQEISNICENILENAGISGILSIKIPSNDLPNYFFEKILTLDIISSIPTIFSSQLGSLLARYTIVNQLNVPYYDNSELKKEAKSLVSRLIAYKCSQEAGQGKVYVDKESIKNKLNTYVKNELELLNSSTERELKTIYINEDEQSEHLYLASYNEYTNKFIELLSYILQEYAVDKVYGIDQSLNVGIRHGGMKNLLWAPIKNNNLESLKLPDGKFAKKSSQCMQDIKYYKDEIIDNLDKEITSLNSKIDEIIIDSRNRVHVNFGEFINKNTIFNYSLDMDSLNELTNKDIEIDSDTLFDFLFAVLDAQTDEFLIFAREKFLRELEGEYISSFDNVKKISDEYGINTITTNIAKAKIDIKENIKTLKSYFNWRRLPVTHFDFDTAIVKAESVINDINPWSNFRINKEINLSSIIDGKFFNHFVTIFTLVFENITKHNQSFDNSYVYINKKDQDGKVEIKITNELQNPLSETSLEKIDSIQKKINSDFIENASKENGSGVSKTKRILTLELKLKNNINILTTPNSFSVVIIIENFNEIEINENINS